jgi:hypothetical protein
VLAPFGGYAFNLAAITAAICMGREAHEDPHARYTAAVVAGVFYLLWGWPAARWWALLRRFPRPGAGGGGPGAAGHHRRRAGAAALARRPSRRGGDHLPGHAVGRELAGIGSAFWGVVAGTMALLCNSGALRRALTPGCDYRWICSSSPTRSNLQDLQGLHLRDDARGRSPRPRAAGLRAAPGPALAARRPVTATVRDITLTGDAHDWFQVVASSADELPLLAEADAVLMRKDPPFDSEYFYATHLLGAGRARRRPRVQPPAALRDHPEKLAILEFPQFIGPRLVTREPADVRAFHAEHRTSSSSRWTAWAAWASSASARRPEPGQHHRDAEPRRHADADGAEVPARHREGDKRILVIGGEPVPFCWRASRRAARCAATWPPAARAWPSR